MNECLLNRDPQWPSHLLPPDFFPGNPRFRNACKTCPLKKNRCFPSVHIAYRYLEFPPAPESLAAARTCCEPATCIICPSLAKAPALNEILHKTNHNNGTTDGEFAAVVVQHYQQQQHHRQQPHRRHVFANFSARDDRRSWMGYNRVSAQPRGR